MTDDPIRAAFEATFRAPPHEWHPRLFDRNSDGQAWPGQYRVYQTDVAWDAYRSGRAAAIEEAAQACEDEATIEGIAQRCAARIRAMVKP